MHYLAYCLHRAPHMIYANSSVVNAAPNRECMSYRARIWNWSVNKYFLMNFGVTLYTYSNVYVCLSSRNLFRMTQSYTVVMLNRTIYVKHEKRRDFARAVWYMGANFIERKRHLIFQLSAKFTRHEHYWNSLFCATTAVGVLGGEGGRIANIESSTLSPQRRGHHL